MVKIGDRVKLQIDGEIVEVVVVKDARNINNIEKVASINSKVISTINNGQVVEGVEVLEVNGRQVELSNNCKDNNSKRKTLVNTVYVHDIVEDLMIEKEARRLEKKHNLDLSLLLIGRVPRENIYRIIHEIEIARARERRVVA